MGAYGFVLLIHGSEPSVVPEGPLVGHNAAVAAYVTPSPHGTPVGVGPVSPPVSAAAVVELFLLNNPLTQSLNVGSKK